MSAGLQAALAGLIAALVALRGLAVACVLAALLGLALRSLLLVVLERGGNVVVTLLRLLACVSFGGLGLLYFVFAARSIAWTPAAFAVALATAAALVGSVWLRRRPAGWRGCRVRSRRSPSSCCCWACCWSPRSPSCRRASWP